MENKKNYNKEMKKVVEENKKQGAVPSLLLHACCAPCSSACMERVRDEFETTVFFYNPNITDAEEYNRRAKELERLIGEYNKMKHNGEIYFLEGRYEPREFTAIAKGYENCPERGKRCLRCYELRLKEAAKEARERGFDYFTTTLTISPLKDADVLNEIGYRAAKEINEFVSIGGKSLADKEIKWLPSDFKKDDGYKRSTQLSHEYNLYRQDYCGCVYSSVARQ